MVENIIKYHRVYFTVIWKHYSVITLNIKEGLYNFDYFIKTILKCLLLMIPKDIYNYLLLVSWNFDNVFFGS